MLIWKCHHSLCDGIAVMCLHLGLGNGYDNSKLLPIKKATFL